MTTDNILVHSSAVCFRRRACRVVAVVRSLFFDGSNRFSKHLEDTVIGTLVYANCCTYFTVCCAFLLFTFCTFLWHYCTFLFAFVGRPSSILQSVLSCGYLFVTSRKPLGVYIAAVFVAYVISWE